MKDSSSNLATWVWFWFWFLFHHATARWILVACGCCLWSLGAYFTEPPKIQIGVVWSAWFLTFAVCSLQFAVYNLQFEFAVSSISISIPNCNCKRQLAQNQTHVDSALLWCVCTVRIVVMRGGYSNQIWPCWPLPLKRGKHKNYDRKTTVKVGGSRELRAVEAVFGWC